ncbi:MAG: hypothetical protein E6H10_13775 [Bacteroidetes bacterium]|nr:MAG: hypothetical protein E6H10_13775 [Bacteroidota bacterium]
MSIIFVLFEILYFFVGHFHSIDSVPIGIETILILVYTFYLFYEQFQTMEAVYIYTNYWFWIIVGILFYLSSSFFFYILANNNYKTASEYWFLTYIFETIKNILFVIGFVFFARKSDNDKKDSSTIPYLDMVNP